MQAVQQEEPKCAPVHPTIDTLAPEQYIKEEGMPLQKIEVQVYEI